MIIWTWCDDCRGTGLILEINIHDNFRVDKRKTVCPKCEVKGFYPEEVDD